MVINIVLLSMLAFSTLFPIVTGLPVAKKGKWCGGLPGRLWLDNSYITIIQAIPIMIMPHHRVRRGNFAWDIGADSKHEMQSSRSYHVPMVQVDHPPNRQKRNSVSMGISPEDWVV